MTKFLSKLRTEQDQQQFTLLAVLVYQDEVHGLIEVPEGFVSNYASLGALKNILLFAVYALLVTYGNRAAVVHDYLYAQATLSRREADKLFYRALRADGVARWRALIFWVGVRIGGSSHYGKE